MLLSKQNDFSSLEVLAVRLLAWKGEGDRKCSSSRERMAGGRLKQKAVVGLYPPRGHPFLPAAGLEGVGRERESSLPPSCSEIYTRIFFF